VPLVRSYASKIRAKGGYYGGIWMRSVSERVVARFFDHLNKEWEYEAEKIELPGSGAGYMPDFSVHGLLLGTDDPIYVEYRPVGNENEKAVALAELDVPVLLFYGLPNAQNSYAVLHKGQQQHRVQFGHSGFLQPAAKDARLLDSNVPHSIWKAAWSASSFSYDAANKSTVQALIGVAPDVLQHLSRAALLLLQLMGTAIREPAMPEQVVAGGETAGLSAQEAVDAYQELLATGCLVCGNKRLEQLRAAQERTFRLS
jgi:hypothetical protein